MKLIRLFILCVFCVITFQLFGQDQYRAEIGINGGGSYYIGDANNKLFNNMQLAYSGFLRYCHDYRLAAKFEITNTKILGPGFSNRVLTADLTGEFNFFDLEKNEYKRFSKIFSPYIFVGLGEMFYTNNSNMSIPFGVGMKVKLGNRWNLNAQWTNRLLLADNLEGLNELNDPKKLNGSNIFNNDLLSTVTVGVSFDIWKKQCDCKNTSVIKRSFF